MRKNCLGGDTIDGLKRCELESGQGSKEFFTYLASPWLTSGIPGVVILLNGYS
jgi:hypothetical protein